MISYELVESVEELRSLEGAWTALQEQAQHTPFQDWAWHHSWWKHLGAVKGQRQFIMTAWESSRLKLILPLAISKNGDELQWSAGEVSDYCDAVVAREDVWLIPQAVDRSLSKFSGARLKMKQVRRDSLAYGELSKMKKHLEHDDFVCPVVHVDPQGYDSWMSSVDRKAAGEANRRMRRLKEAGEVSLRVSSGVDEIQASVTQLITDKKEWLIRRGANNILCTDAGIYFLNEALICMEINKHVHVTSLKCDDVTIANQISFIHGERYYYYFGAWNLSWKNFSPGKLHMLLLVKYAHENGFKEFDMLRGAEEYKDAFSSSTNTLIELDFERAGVYAFLKSVAGNIKRSIG